MDALAVSGLQLSPVKDFDQIVEIRAEKHAHLRGRNNVTSCRSPTRENTKLIKNELKEKRHQEFLRRRSVWSEQVTPTRREEKGHARVQASTSTHHWTPNIFKAQKMSFKTFIQTENQKLHIQSENILPKKILREASVQTESGLVTVKESDVQRLAGYLQEALWREEAVKKKLAVLQRAQARRNCKFPLCTSEHRRCKHTPSQILTHCSEDLLRNKIKALEAQLQVCLQKFPKDGVKKLVLQMEKQKLVYEEKALVALQKATQEKTEALTKAETMQEALITAKAEALRWQSLYEELKLSSGQLQQNQLLSNEQLQQLHSQVELSRAREAELRQEVVSLTQEKRELQYNIYLLKEDNQMLREEIQHLRDNNNKSLNSTTQGHLASEEPEPPMTVRKDSQVEEQLRHTQEKLRLKERECEELQTELHAMEQECQSSQARLSQCRDELRQLSHRRRTPAPCGSWWKVWMFFFLLLVVAEVAMLWLWYPPFREQVEDLYSDIETRIEDYLMEMASPQHSGCFRPI
ncbi:hypothetical protein D5F01_LYC08476 [Larimichthys crocea]|uniref:TRAF3-interacting JNK-activating modulator n=1 Tax=Larimichthys crocea TaxID=215358 RepID=A0A6G0IPB5_LARCR|nr:hypothetical protein D5F01_LYC08476 [Larimichthys crocea]